MATDDTALENAIFALGEVYLEKRLLDNAVTAKDAQLRAVEEIAIESQNRVGEIETELADAWDKINTLTAQLEKLKAKKGRK